MFNNPFEGLHMYLKHSWTLLFCSILHSAFYGNISTVMTNKKIKISWTNQAVNTLLFRIRVKKVTDWTSAMSAACRLLTASVWYIGRVSIGQEEWGEKRKTNSGLHMGRLSYGVLPTRAVQWGPVSPMVQVTSMQAFLCCHLHALANS